MGMDLKDAFLGRLAGKMISEQHGVDRVVIGSCERLVAESLKDMDDDDRALLETVMAITDEHYNHTLQQAKAAQKLIKEPAIAKIGQDKVEKWGEMGDDLKAAKVLAMVSKDGLSAARNTVNTQTGVTQALSDSKPSPDGKSKSTPNTYDVADAEKTTDELVRLFREDILAGKGEDA